MMNTPLSLVLTDDCSFPILYDMDSPDIALPLKSDKIPVIFKSESNLITEILLAILPDSFEIELLSFV